MPSGVELATAFVSLAVSTRGLGRDVSRELGGMERQAVGTGKRMGSTLTAGIGGSFKALGGMVAALGVADFLGGAIAEARESQKVGALTAQVIKSTGGAAKVTAGQVSDLAQAISNKTGIDDEAIQSSQNMLLTFTNVQNKVGKGNDIFNQATQTITDMSAALGQDGKSSAIQLGKALNDPVKGVTALQRVGVSFTAAQKNQIAGMVKAGDTMGAQKVILAELNKEFGGAAEAQATAGDKLSVSWGNFQEMVGTALLPVLDSLFNSLSAGLGWVMDNSDAIAAPFRTIGTVLQPALDSVKLFFGAVTGQGADVEVPWMNTIIDAGAQVRGAIELLKTAFGAFFLALQEGDVTSDGLVGAFETVGDFLHRVLPQAIAVGQAAFQAVVGYIAAEVIPRVMGIVGAIRDLVVVAIPIVAGFVQGMIARIAPLMPTIRSIFAQIGTIIGLALDLIKAVIERVTSVIAFVWRNWGQGIMDFVALVFGKVLGIIQPALGTIQGLIRFFTAIFKGDWSGAWQAMKDTISSAFTTIKRSVDLGLTLVGKALSIAWAGIKLAASAAWGGIVSAISEAFGGLVRSISGPIDAALGFIQRNLIDPINRMLSALGISWRIGTIWTPAVTNLAFRGTRARIDRRFANAYDTGGWTGPGAKMQPAGVVHADEFVLRKEATNRLRSRFGLGFLDHMNRTGSVPGYAEGGLVGGLWDRLVGIGRSVGDFFMDPASILRRLIGSVLGGLTGGPLSQLAAGAAGKALGAVADKVRDTIGSMVSGGGGINAAGIQWGSQRLDSDTARRIQMARLTSGLPLTIIQGSWSNNPLSMGTHAGAGAFDATTTDWGRAVSALRGTGLLAMFRNWSGNQHIHALNPFVSGLSPQAMAQVRRARGNGGIFASGGLVPKLYDQGGLLQPGLTLVSNQTGKPETVLPPDTGRIDYARLAREIASAVESGAFRGTAAGMTGQARELSWGAV